MEILSATSAFSASLRLNFPLGLNLDVDAGGEAPDTSVGKEGSVAMEAGPGESDGSGGSDGPDGTDGADGSNDANASDGVFDTSPSAVFGGLDGPP